MIKLLETLKTYWVQIITIVGLIGACSVFPFRLEAMDSRQKKLEEAVTKTTEQTTALYRWVEAQQKEKEYEAERIKSAPPGYRWDSSNKEYVKEKVS